MGCCGHTAQCSASSPIALISPTLTKKKKKKINHRLADYKITLSTNQMDPLHECIWERDYRKCLENRERAGGDWRNLLFIVFKVDQCESASSVSKLRSPRSDTRCTSSPCGTLQSASCLTKFAKASW